MTVSLGSEEKCWISVWK